MSAEFLLVQTFALTAGQPLDLAFQANFFQLFQAPTAVDVEFFARNTSVGKATAAPEGFRRGPVAAGKEWDRVKITSGINQSVQICLAFGEASLQRIVGSITATLSKAATNADDADALVTTVAPLNIAADANRRAIVISSAPTNPDVLRISKTGGARGEFLQPGTSCIVNTTDAIQIYNPNAASAGSTVGVRYEKD